MYYRTHNFNNLILSSCVRREHNCSGCAVIELYQFRHTKV
jgi:hypothetical protein